MIVVSVHYPKTGELHFDMDYYLQVHIPLVKKLVTSMGMERLDLLHGSADLAGGPAQFEVIAQLHFTSVEHLQAALAQHGAEIIGDIPKFTNVQPLMQINEPL